MVSSKGEYVAVCTQKYLLNLWSIRIQVNMDEMAFRPIENYGQSGFDELTVDFLMPSSFSAEFDLDKDNGLNWIMDVFQYMGPTYSAAVMYYVRQRALFALAAFDSLVRVRILFST